MKDISGSLDACIKCNICTSYCPVSEVTDLFPGPKYVGPQAERFRQNDAPDRAVDYCSGCRVCNQVCPEGVPIAEMNGRARAKIVAEEGLSWRNWLLGRSELLGKVGSIAPKVANFLLHNRLSRWGADRVLGIAEDAPLPTWSEKGRFSDWLQGRESSRLRSEKKVVYFHGCATSYYEPFIGQATIVVLEHLGYEVIVPEQNCCGLPMLSNGEFETAERYHLQNVKQMIDFVGTYPIVGSSTSCTLTLKEEASALLGLKNVWVDAFAQEVWDLFEWLFELYEKEELPLTFRPLNQRIPYHMPCQYRAHQVGQPAAEILRLIPGVVLAESEARCCGIAGTYGLKKEKYEIGMAVGEELFQFVAEQEGALLTACDSETCRWQLEHGTGLPSRHPIEILAAAYQLYDLEKRALL